MSYPQQLLELAEATATLGAGRPRQANLDRAVSTAYYAAFHAVCDLVARRVGGDEAERISVRRCVSHNELAEVCRTVGGGNFPNRDGIAFPGFAVSSDLRMIALGIQELRADRNVADYDRSSRLTISTVRQRIELATRVVGRIDKVASTPEGQWFALLVLIYAKLKRLPK